MAALTTPQAIINRARGLWSISSGQYQDEAALEDFNAVHKLVCWRINSEIDEDYFTDFLTSDIAANQNEYALTDTTNSININKVAKVEVKKTATSGYTEFALKDEGSLSRPLEDHNSSANSFYFILDDSAFIYWAPTEGIAGWLRITASLSPTDLAIADTTILLEETYREIIVAWLLPYIYQRKGKLNEKQFAADEFENKLSELIVTLSDRTSTPQEVVTPNLDYYG